MYILDMKIILKLKNVNINISVVSVVVENKVLKHSGTTGITKVNVHLICCSVWAFGLRAAAGVILIMALIGSFTDRPVRA